MCIYINFLGVYKNMFNLKLISKINIYSDLGSLSKFKNGINFKKFVSILIYVLISLSVTACSCSSSTGGDVTTPTSNIVQPSASFTQDKKSGQSPLAIKFTNTSTNANSYLWDFGDGQTSGEESPVHTFTNTTQSDITRTVNLTAKGVAGSTDSNANVVITVNPPPPGIIQLDANFKASSETGTGPSFTVWFTNNSNNAGAVNYTWSFGDGTPTSTIFSPSHTFINETDSSITRTVVLSVSGADKTIPATFSRVITINNYVIPNDQTCTDPNSVSTLCAIDPINAGNPITVIGSSTLKIIADPTHQIVFSGNRATFTVDASLTGGQPDTITYTWYSNSNPPRMATNYIPVSSGIGVNWSTYTSPITTGDDNGRGIRVRVCKTSNSRACLISRAAYIVVFKKWEGQEIDLTGNFKPRNIVISNDGLSALVGKFILNRASTTSNWNTTQTVEINIPDPTCTVSDSNGNAVGFINDSNALLTCSNNIENSPTIGVSSLYIVTKTAGTWSSTPTNIGRLGYFAISMDFSTVNGAVNSALILNNGLVPSTNGTINILDIDTSTTPVTVTIRSETLTAGLSAQELAIDSAGTTALVVNRCHGSSTNCGSNVQVFKRANTSTSWASSMLRQTIDIGPVVSSQEGLLARSRGISISPEGRTAFISNRWNNGITELSRPDTNVSTNWRSVGAVQGTRSQAKILFASDGLTTYFVNPNTDNVNFLYRPNVDSPWTLSGTNINISQGNQNITGAACLQPSGAGYGMVISKQSNTILISCTAAEIVGLANIPRARIISYILK